MSLLPRPRKSSVCALRAVEANPTSRRIRTGPRARAATSPATPPDGSGLEPLLSVAREPRRGAARDKSEVPLRDEIAEHRPFVRASLRHLGVDGNQLDDAEQDVFLVVLRRERDFDPTRGTSYRGWMWGVCRNVAASYRRNARRARRHAPPLDRAIRPPIEERLAAHHMLAALDENSRAVWLGRCEGRSAKELADALAVPVTTVEWRLRKARDAVRATVRGLVRHTDGWIGWVLRPERGLVSLAVPVLALSLLLPSLSGGHAPPVAPDHARSSPEQRTATNAHDAVPTAREPVVPLLSNGPRPEPLVAHVEEHEPTVRTVEARRTGLVRRRRASGLVALGDPSVSAP